MSGSVRINAIRHLPEILRELGVDLGEALALAGIRPGIFDDPENRVSYPEVERLVDACERLSRSEQIAFLSCQRTRLADFGIAGRIAVCSDTVGEALRRFCDHYNLHGDAAIVSLIMSGDYARLVYSIVAQDVIESRHFQLGSVTIFLNILRELCGSAFVPTVATFATRKPLDLRPIHGFFRAPVRFDSEESALVFERRWLDKPLPTVDPRERQRIEGEARAQWDQVLADSPGAVRRILRRQLLLGECSMDDVAAMLGMHRRTLDRHLQMQGVRYGALVESVEQEIAHQLLRETELEIQQIASALRFSGAANFATAFRRWTGMAPSEYRRQAR